MMTNEANRERLRRLIDEARALADQLRSEAQALEATAAAWEPIVEGRAPYEGR